MEKTILQVHIPYSMLLKRLAFFAAKRINPEVYIDGDSLRSMTEDELHNIYGTLQRAGLKATIHGPFLKLNPGSFDNGVRAATVESYKKVFTAVRILKPRSMVLHAGYNERAGASSMKAWLTQSMKTWPEFVRMAESEGVVIALENVFDKDPLALKALVTAIGSPNVGVCFDTGHLNVFASAPVEQWFAELGRHVRHLHLHDNHGDSDEHLPVGDGIIDFDRFFGLLKVHAMEPIVYTIEPHGEDQIERAIKAVRKYVQV